MSQVTQEQYVIAMHPCLYIAIELAEKSWKLAFSDGRRKPRVRTIPGRNLDAFFDELELAKKRFGLAEDVRVKSCYEAGRDGFWLHRYLEHHGVQNLVVDASSIEVARKRRRRKTDKIDARKLVAVLIRLDRGEREACSIVRIPGAQDEDDRRFERERERLIKEREQHCRRIESLLVTQGIRLKVDRHFSKNLHQIRLWDGTELGFQLTAELKRQYQRLQLVQQHLKELAADRKRYLKAGGKKADKITKLQTLRSIGPVTGWKATTEFFGWRTFRNGKQVGSAAGLTGTPYNTGNSSWEQGISKAGNPRIRKLMVEIAWLWIRHQPKSKHTIWFKQRFANGSKRMRRVGIVAVARKVLIDLWRFLEEDRIPEGALLKAA
jgi:transposase